MNATFDPNRSGAIRALLIDQARRTVAPRTRIWRASALIAAGAIGGAVLSTAAFAATQNLAADPVMPSGEPTPSLGPAIDAPAGTSPGAPVIVLLGDSAVFAITKETTVPLTDRPSGATHARVTVTPQSGGTLLWGTDPTGNNPSGTWGASEVGAASRTEGDFPLDSTTDNLYFTPFSGFTGLALVQYITQIPTHLGVNENGETYGVEGGPDGTPDLISAWAIAPDGSRVEGYVRTVDLNASSPDHPGMPTSPAQAGEWQGETANNYPNGWDIPAYESDGVTQVGAFHIDG